MADVESLHGSTPAEMFDRGQANIDGIQAVALSVPWADGSIAAGWSNVDVGTPARMVPDAAQRRRTIPPDEA